LRNEEVLCGVQEEKKILHTIEKRKVDWIFLVLHSNFLQKHVTEGKVKEE
jgi:hypothetical protein